MSDHTGRRAIAPFCEVDSRSTRHRYGARTQPVEVQRHDLDTDGQRVAVHHARPQGLDSDSVGRGPDDTDGDLGNGAEFATVYLHTDSGPLSDGSGGRFEPQGVWTMEQVFALLTVASGYVIAFGIGAWIGRPILELVTNRIFKK